MISENNDNKNRAKNILLKINKDNIFDVLDKEFSNYIFTYDTDEEYIVSNIIALRYETKNEKIEMVNKINNFLIENIDEFKNLNVDIICKSPYFEEQIEMERRKEEERKLEEIVEEGIETCYKCNSKRIRIMYKQVRSADEGETGFFECSECGNKWIK